MMLLAVIAAFFAACGSEVPDLKNPAPVTDRNVGNVEGAGTDNLKAKAVGENDFYGQAKWALGALQEEYNQASGKVPGVGKVSVMVDENFTMIIRNDNGGQIEETKVNLNSLNDDLKSLEIYPEGVKTEFPGFRIPVLKGKPAVEVNKNGKMEKQDYLEIFLSERKSVERVISGLRQAMQSAQESQKAPAAK